MNISVETRKEKKKQAGVHRAYQVPGMRQTSGSISQKQGGHRTLEEIGRYLYASTGLEMFTTSMDCPRLVSERLNCDCNTPLLMVQRLLSVCLIVRGLAC